MVFANRWKAMWWATTILATAYCSVPSADQTAASDHTKQAVEHPVKHPVNPWAKDSN